MRIDVINMPYLCSGKDRAVFFDEEATRTGFKVWVVR